MADFTKKAIRDSFLNLLSEKPLKQISVRDIVDKCGINRNTFYYHFQDIPQLLESIISEDADRLILDHPSIDSMEECLDAIIDFSLKNKTVVLHIYRSINRDIFEQYQWRVCDRVVTKYIDGLLDGRTISPEDRKFIISYVKCVSFGLVIGWLDGGMEDEIHKFAHRICQLKLGNLSELIDRCVST